MQTPRSKFPIEVKSGSSVVKIYANKRSDGREIFQVGWYLGGRRLKQFNDLRAAKGFAKQQADDLRRKTSSESSTRNQVLEYSEAKRLCGNESLVNVVKECLKAREMTGDQTILAAKQFANTITHHETLSVSKVCELFVEAKRAAGIKVERSYKNYSPPFQGSIWEAEDGLNYDESATELAQRF